MGAFKPAWDLEYDCSVLPNVAKPLWDNITGINLMSIVNGMLYINDNSTTSPAGLEMKNIINSKKIVTCEFNIKIVSSNISYALSIQINDGEKGIMLGLEPTKINIFNDDNFPQVTKSIDVDLTDFNTIKLIKYGQTKFQVYINDILIEENNYLYNTNENIVGIGATASKYTGSCYIKNIRYCLDGIPIYYPNSYLINQNNNYYSTKSNFLNLGQPIDNIQLENWYNKYGSGDVNIITQNLNNKEFPMSKNENGIWKTEFQLDMNDVTDNIELVDIDENNKSIKYNCNDYRILDLCNDQFKLTMCKTK
ncbi:hypothetical protein [Clostridium botulinum]|uniref:Cell adhesion protein n=1 Tax=Clostridium botulinum (strain Langeland / NCTC 10281 / Type F) TaxID=441772 RepID=A7GHN4_CLOBL|nr:hypothetical protein [Clostridium botulinum]ABS39358.1 conserved hypothetical protein [Clostridium botulinum F str. Langeland]ADG00665.1 conserved hypothetical protein [Clostridium botulinum F str. 230613]KKM40831.1 hypothetical protein VT72_12165 [Clostridium botulinum]MBY6792376.1 hypothetical protein [Clostridium botulinum]MBY6937982.1 hypothetical protein [Clostridium botulinum]